MIRKMNIRRAEEKDMDGINHLLCQVLMVHHNGDNILTDIKTLYIDDLCVDEQIRGKHIGRQIYEYVLAFAKEQGFYNVTLNVWSCNPTAMKFYENCGLVPYKIGMEKIL